MGKDDFKYLSQEFDSKVQGLVKHNGFDYCEYMGGFERFKEEMPSKEKFYSSLTCKKISDKEYEHFFKVWNRFEMKIKKDYHDCT